MVRIAFGIALITEMKRQETYYVIKIMMKYTTNMKIDWDGDIQRIKQNINQIWME
jgi:hypothetical protein